MKINKIILMLALMTIVISFNACKKEAEEGMLIPPPSTEQKLKFHIHNMVGANALDYTTEFTNSSGRKFNMSDCRYYISNIVLIKSDNTELPLSGKVLLVNPSIDDYELATVPVGGYKGFRFVLGLDSATNHSNITAYSAGNPLAVQTPSMHWTWSSGYLFMKLEGNVDTTLANTGTPNVEFFYHIALDNFKRTIDFSSESFTVSSGSDKEIVLEFNLLDALNNVDMRTEYITHSNDNVPLATKIADNWQGAFSVE